jgi:hypothetical protein
MARWVLLALAVVVAIGGSAAIYTVLTALPAVVLIVVTILAAIGGSAVVYSALIAQPAAVCPGPNC